MSALRQALVISACLLVFQFLGALIASETVQNNFAQRLQSEFQRRFNIVAADIEKNGFNIESFPKYSGEVVYFEADPASAAAAPEGIFELRGAIDDDHWTETDEPNWFGFGEGDHDFDDWYFYVGEAGGSVLAIGTNLTASSLFQGLLLRGFVITGVIVSIVTVLIGFVFSLRAQSKLNRISSVLDDVAQGQFESRIESPRSKDDLDDLSRDVDRTLEQLEVLFNQTRNLSMNIAHDLKTPLARLRLRLENAALEEDQNRARDNVVEALDQADHIIAVFEAFLRIGRLETGSVRKRFQDVDLAELAREVASTFEPVVEDAGYKFELRVEGQGRIHGDAVLLTQFLTNLIENALRHTPQGSTISLIVRDQELGVADDGPGIPAEAYAEVVKPSVRLESARTSPGAGLGLALVDTIARVHDAKLVLSQNPYLESRGLYVAARFL